MSIKDINKLRTINEVEEYRKSVNEACDNRAKDISIFIKAYDLSKKPFGQIKECFEAISPELFKTDEGKAIMNRYSKAIKESKNLSALHSLYENIRKANANSDVDFFINNIANANWGVDKKTVAEDCEKLGRILAEGYIAVSRTTDVALPKENASLSSAVSFIAENKKTSKNIAEFSNAVKVIRESVEKNNDSANIFESRNIDALAAELIDEFNQKYSSQLTEGEVEALKEVSCSENREDVFNRYKEACQKKLSEAKENFDKEGNATASEKIASILEQVSGKKYVLETLGSDICGLIQLSNIF